MKKILIAVTLGLFCSALPAFAFDTDAPHSRRHLQGKDGFLASLNLTDSQKSDLRKLRTEREKRGVELRANMEKARIDLRALLMSDTPDKSAIEKKMKDVAQCEADLRMNRIDGWFETNKLLTPDQQKIWVKALRVGTMRAMREGRMPKHPGIMRHQPRPMNAPTPPPAEQ
ncbi:MAG TPA: Spy/CpxP family protein refolding chaperone [Bacteroidota bacterium]|nr:Spy/CpxP family protein refolding chaperone [Bacteroidota bacterium]